MVRSPDPRDPSVLKIIEDRIQETKDLLHLLINGWT